MSIPNVLGNTAVLQKKTSDIVYPSTEQYLQHFIPYIVGINLYNRKKAVAVLTLQCPGFQFTKKASQESACLNA